MRESLENALQTWQVKSNRLQWNREILDLIAKDNCWVTLRSTTLRKATWQCLYSSRVDVCFHFCKVQSPLLQSGIRKLLSNTKENTSAFKESLKICGMTPHNSSQHNLSIHDASGQPELVYLSDVICHFWFHMGYAGTKLQAIQYSFF